MERQKRTEEGGGENEGRGDGGKLGEDTGERREGEKG